MKTNWNFLWLFRLLFPCAMSMVIRTASTHADRFSSRPSRKLGANDIVNYITTSYPYMLGMPGGQNFQTVSVDFNGDPNAATETIPKNQKIVYNIMHFPGLANDSFNLYSLARAWDPYFGLKPPFNLHHPSNYLLGFHPYPYLGYSPIYPNLFQDPFKTGIYGGYGYGMQGMMSPYILNPISSSRESVQPQMQELLQRLQEARLKINGLEKISNSSKEKTSIEKNDVLNVNKSKEKTEVQKSFPSKKQGSVKFNQIKPQQEKVQLVSNPEPNKILNQPAQPEALVANNNTSLTPPIEENLAELNPSNQENDANILEETIEEEKHQENTPNGDSTQAIENSD